MAANKPTIVIVPGAWQLRSSWEAFISIARSAGYPIEYVDPPTLGGTALPLAGLADDVKAVRDTLDVLLNEGKRVTILCHSAGGLVASNAVEGLDTASRAAGGLKGGVSQVIFVSAFMVPAGKSLLGLLGGQPLPWMKLMDDRVVGNPEMMPNVVFNDLDEDAQKKWSNEMTHSALGLFTTPSGFEPWANSIPIAYIFCTEDNALPYPVQQQLSLQGGPDLVSVQLDAGHCPFLSIPDRLLTAMESIMV
ncbi:hypothetical protein AUP68_00167 [Ilyonectria robusta]